MRNSMLILATVTCLSGTSTAFAQESDTAPAKSFAGPRVEATVGVDHTNHDGNGGGGGLTTMRVGGAIGYDLAIGDHVTLGVEAGIGWGVAGHRPVVATNGTTVATVTAAHDADVSARLGYAVTPHTLIYAKAGWADAAYRVTSNGQTYYGNNDKGVRFGVGIEQKLTKQVHAKVEYRYSMYGNAGAGQDNGRHQLLTGVGVRF